MKNLTCKIYDLKYIYFNESKHANTRLHKFALNNGYKFIKVDD